MLYRAAFCAGCHALHDLCGRPASLLVNYDQTVLALVLAGLGDYGDPEGKPCTALPFRTMAVQPLDDRAAALLAALDVGAVRAKLLDDIEDGDRPLAKRVVLRALRRPSEKARAALRRLGFPLSLLDELPRAQAEAERQRDPDIAVLAEPSATLVGQVFAHAALAADRPQHAAVLRSLGEALGAWVYAFDAWRDLPDDVRRGRFNAWTATGCRDPRLVADHLDARVTEAAAAVALVPLGAQGRVLAALLASLRGRNAAVRIAPWPLRARDARQAGDCDCACDGCSCCGEAAGGAADTSCQPTCVCCCDDLCCCWTERAQRNRTLRRAARTQRRGGDVAEVDLAPLVGAEGEAATDLLPRGRVTVRGLTFDAEAETARIERGAAVVVTAAERGRLRVVRKQV